MTPAECPNENIDATPCLGMLATNSTYAWIFSSPYKCGRIKAANAEAFTLFAEPVFMVGIAIHSMGVLSSSMMTMAPDKPGSIPMRFISFL
jgi:hypothetical protein